VQLFDYLMTAKKVAVTAANTISKLKTANLEAMRRNEF